MKSVFINLPRQMKVILIYLLSIREADKIEANSKKQDSKDPIKIFFAWNLKQSEQENLDICNEKQNNTEKAFSFLSLFLSLTSE